jgi:D-alanine-D-alanine ligase
MKAHALIVHSGTEARPDEADTLVQLREVKEILEKNAWQVSALPFQPSLAKLKEKIDELRPQFIFNLVESVNNTDALSYVAAAFFEHLGYPYTGSCLRVLKKLSNKTHVKRLLMEHGLPSPDYFELHNKIGDNSDAYYIVKSDSENASLGLDSTSVVRGAFNAQAQALRKTLEYSQIFFAERFIKGREFNIAIIEDPAHGMLILPPAEIVTSEGLPLGHSIVDYAAKWDESSQSYKNSHRKLQFAAHDQKLLAELFKLSKACWHVFELNGLVRIDFRVDESGQPWILEINPGPCLSSDAGLVAQAFHGGMSQEDLVLKLTNLARGQL